MCINDILREDKRENKKVKNNKIQKIKKQKVRTGKTQRDRVEREVGGGDRDGEYMYIQGWFMSIYDKNHYNFVK